MTEMWRVLRPNGTLYLTTVIANSHRDEFVGHKLYGDASAQVGEDIFFSRYYDDETLDERVLGGPWEIEACERVRQVDRTTEATLYRFAPWTYPFGFVLRWLCPTNFAFIDSAKELADDEYGVIYLKLRKPNVGDAGVVQ